MARISNTSIYPNIDPVLSDYFVLTDANDDLSTKTCTLEALKKLYNVDVVSKSVTVSSTYLNVLATQDFELLPAPGANMYYYDWDVWLEKPNGTTVSFGVPASERFFIAINGNYNATLTEGTTIHAVSTPLIIQGSSRDLSYAEDASGDVFSYAITPNQSLILGTWSGTNPSTNTGNWTAYIKYKVKTIGESF